MRCCHCLPKNFPIIDAMVALVLVSGTNLKAELEVRGPAIQPPSLPSQCLQKLRCPGFQTSSPPRPSPGCPCIPTHSCQAFLSQLNQPLLWVSAFCLSVEGGVLFCGGKGRRGRAKWGMLSLGTLPGSVHLAGPRSSETELSWLLRMTHSWSAECFPERLSSPHPCGILGWSVAQTQEGAFCIIRYCSPAGLTSFTVHPWSLGLATAEALAIILLPWNQKVALG